MRIDLREEANKQETDVLYRYLIPVTERQPEALYVYKSRGFGGEDRSVTVYPTSPLE